MTDSYQMIVSCIDIVSKCVSHVDRTRMGEQDAVRNKDYQDHAINALRLDMQRMADYEAELSEENFELVKRLGLFEDELQNLQMQYNKTDKLKDEYQAKYEENQLTIYDKNLEIERVCKEKMDLQTQVKNLHHSVNMLEAIADSQKEDAMQNIELAQDLDSINKKLFVYKSEFGEKKIECEKLELKLNALESQVTTYKLDLKKESEFNKSLKSEIKDLKERLVDLENQKKGYMNNLGVSKLGISQLNFSKMYQHEAMPMPTMPVSRLVSNRESIVRAVNRPNANMGYPIGSLLALKKDIPRINLLAADDNKVSINVPTSFNQASVANPYMANNRATRSKFSESRISSVLNMIGGISSTADFELKQDYFGITSYQKSIAELNRLGDEVEAGICYSDTVFLFNKDFKTTRFVIVVTKYSISFFNMRKTKLIKLYLLKSLKGVTISASNYTLCVLHFENQADLLLESFRRLDFISYLNHMFKANDLHKFDICIRKHFVLKSDEKQAIPNKIEVSDPNLKINQSFLQDAVRNSKKSGYLSKVSKSWLFGSTVTTEYFCLLSNIGIVYFKKYGVVVV